MSNKAKYNKQPSRAKENFFLGAKSLINNDACVELGTHHPWYSALIAGVLSVIISIIPIAVSRAQVNGSDFLGSTTNGYETSLVQFEEDAYNAGTNIKVNADTKQIEVTSWESLPGYSATKPFYQLNDVNDGSHLFEVYYTNLEGQDYTDYLTRLITNNKTPYLVDGDYADRGYRCNLLILQTSEIRGYIYLGASATSASSSFTGKYDVPQSFTFSDLLKQNTHGVAYTATYEDSKTSASKLATFLDENKAGFKLFLDDSYYSTKVSTGWAWTGIWAGIFAGFIILMGLLVFLMTRGKQNPYKIITFWQAQKISYWAAPAPAILGMIMSFILSSSMSSLGMFMFIFLYGMRMMWLTMKNLRPQGN